MRWSLLVFVCWDSYTLCDVKVTEGFIPENLLNLAVMIPAVNIGIGDFIT